jgi:LmbE family N-acetylglucosaminyl deacetylase
MTNKLTLLAIFAHPDDEAFGTGGTLTKYAHEGVEVHLITATLGEAGQVANPLLTFNQPLGVVREQELRCACQHYGVKQLHTLGYIDGQTTVAPQGAAVYKLVSLLRELKPQVVISFGPDGIYGHYDHLAVHRWTAAAVQLSGEAERWPELGLRHEVAKFYYRVIPAAQVALMEKLMGRSYVPMDGVPFPFVGYPPNEITTLIDVRAYANLKLAGIRCHASQLATENPYMRPDFDFNDPLFGQETYILARSLTPITGPEDDLFAGLR